MSTANIVLLAILSAILGFAIGNVYGKESIKRTIAIMLTQLTENLKKLSDISEKQKEVNKHE